MNNLFCFLVLMCVGFTSVKAAVAPETQAKQVWPRDEGGISPELIETVKTITGNVAAKVFYKQRASLPSIGDNFPYLNEDQSDKFIRRFTQTSIFTSVRGLGIQVVDAYLSALKNKKEVCLLFLFPDFNNSFSIQLIFHKPENNQTGAITPAWIEVIIYAATNSAPLHAQEFVKESLKSSIPSVVFGSAIGLFALWQARSWLKQRDSSWGFDEPRFDVSGSSLFGPTATLKSRADHFFKGVTEKYGQSGDAAQHIIVRNDSDSVAIERVKAAMADAKCSILVVSLQPGETRYGTVSIEKLIDAMSDGSVGSKYTGQKRIFYLDMLNVLQKDFSQKAKELFANRWFFVMEDGCFSSLTSDVFLRDFIMASGSTSVWREKSEDFSASTKKLTCQMLPYIVGATSLRRSDRPELYSNLGCTFGSDGVTVNTAFNWANSEEKLFFCRELSPAWAVAEKKLWNVSWVSSNDLFLPEEKKEVGFGGGPSVESRLADKTRDLWLSRRFGSRYRPPTFVGAQDFLDFLLKSCTEKFRLQCGSPLARDWPYINVSWKEHSFSGVKAVHVRDVGAPSEDFIAFTYSATDRDVEALFENSGDKETPAIVVASVFQLGVDCVLSRLAKWNDLCVAKNIQLILLDAQKLKDKDTEFEAFSNISLYRYSSASGFLTLYRAKEVRSAKISISDGLKTWLDSHLENPAASD